MTTNTLNHGYTLSGMLTEVKYLKDDRSRSRFGRNGETGASDHHKRSVKRYNKATRKESRLQLSRYQKPVVECYDEHHPLLHDSYDDYTWDELRTEADEWYEENLIKEMYCAVRVVATICTTVLS